MLVLSCFIPSGIISIGVPLTVQWIAIEVMTQMIGSNKPQIVGYLGHRLFVVAFTSSEVLVAYFLNVNSHLCLGMVALMILLHPTYGYVPGKRYPRIADLLSGRRKFNS